MSLVERLREYEPEDGEPILSSATGLMREAADRIEALEGIVRELLAAADDEWLGSRTMRDKARAALGEK